MHFNYLDKQKQHHEINHKCSFLNKKYLIKLVFLSHVIWYFVPINKYFLFRYSINAIIRFAPPRFLFRCVRFTWQLFSDGFCWSMGTPESSILDRWQHRTIVPVEIITTVRYERTDLIFRAKVFINDRVLAKLRLQHGNRDKWRISSRFNPSKFEGWERSFINLVFSVIIQRRKKVH